MTSARTDRFISVGDASIGEFHPILETSTPFDPTGYYFVEVDNVVTMTDEELRYARAGEPMSLEEFEILKSAIRVDDPNRHDKIGAFKQLRYASDWFESDLRTKVISPIKNLRSWAFVLCFLCIGLQTRFAELATFGMKPFWAFTIGVAINVPLGYLLTTQVFVNFWRAL